MEIKVEGRTFTVADKEDETFDIYENGVFAANIYPCLDDVTGEWKWYTGALLALELVQAIGEAIERKEM